MSKHSKSRSADWEVTSDAGEDNPPSVQDFPQSRWERSKRGWYIFRDGKGIVAEFAPGVVLSVIRKDFPEVVVPPDEKALAAVAARTVLAAKRQNGER